MKASKRRFIRKGDRLCIECLCERQRVVVKKLYEYPTAWYGVLVYWRCPECRSKFVSRGLQGFLEVAIGR